MKCHRCGDTMILKKFYDYGGYDWRWKCPRCGEMRDQMGTDNRHVEGVGQWRKSQRKEISVIKG